MSKGLSPVTIIVIVGIFLIAAIIYAGTTGTEFLGIGGKQRGRSGANGYSAYYLKCADGYTETKSNLCCRTYQYFRQKAEETCQYRCENVIGGKCGVLEFLASSPCRVIGC